MDSKKRLEKKLDGNYARMLRAFLNKSWRQHPTRHQLYGHLPPITKTIQVKRSRYAGHCWRSRDELISDVLLWTPTTNSSKSRTTSSNIHTAVLWRYKMLSRRPALKRWKIGKSGKRGSGISVLPARHDDDDIYIYVYIYIYMKGDRRGVMVIVIGNGHGNTSSNPGRDWLHFT